MAVRRDLVGLVSSNARPCVAPTFGAEPLFGTNPIAFGAPSGKDVPFLFDASTSVTQRGRIEVLRRAGRPLPRGWVVDEAGEDLTDAAEALDRFTAGRAALLPLGGRGEMLGGHKGYGLSIMCEILNAAFQEGAYLQGLAGGDREGGWAPYKTGHFFMALDPEFFSGIELFKQTVSGIVETLHAARRETGRDRIYTAGEKEWETERLRRAEGIPVGVPLQRELMALRDELGLGAYRFPVEKTST
jgi:LDH2 family malate/lactate/ureidoglycolate dehydrogenase